LKGPWQHIFEQHSLLGIDKSVQITPSILQTGGVGDGGALPPLDPLESFKGDLLALAWAGSCVPFPAFELEETYCNVPNSMPSIDIDPSSILGSDNITERLWALMTTPTTEARRMNFIVVV
jgi:hypothetical protein